MGAWEVKGKYDSPTNRRADALADRSFTSNKREEKNVGQFSCFDGKTRTTVKYK